MRRGLWGSFNGRRRLCLRCTLGLGLLGRRHVKRSRQATRGQTKRQKSGEQTLGKLGNHNGSLRKNFWPSIIALTLLKATG
ncbi:hypothetical protein AERO9A_140149 [Aeromonas salmonicida]|nr:hypothetical protein AERO9A_140149 [Aeromonas salmonicida]